MSETKHSPEPWSVEPEFVQIECQNPSPVAVCERDGGPSAADSRRIVACVNACQGLSTEALESGALGKALEVLDAAAQPPGTHTVKGLRGLAASALRSLGRLK